MPTTTNYGWTTPADTDLVKDGALAIRTLGSSIDTTVFNNANSVIKRNYITNGGFNVAQRGTSFTASNNNDDAYTLDRWYILSDGNDVIDVTQETTEIPTNGEFAIALDVETVNKKFGIATIIENKDLIGLVGNTVTFSFKGKVSTTTKLDNIKAAIVSWSGTADTVTSDIISAWNVEGTNPTLIANATYENTPVNLNLTTSYATYSVSAAIDTASTNNVILLIWSDVTDTTLGHFLYLAETKLEVGSIATAFNYAAGTFQGELAACQRYYVQFGGDAAYERIANGSWSQTTNFAPMLFLPTSMRVAPSVLTYANLNTFDGASFYAISSITIDAASKHTVQMNVATAASTQYRFGQLLTNNTTSGYLGLSAEL